MVKRFIDQLHCGQCSILKNDIINLPATITAEKIYEAAINGDQLAYDIIVQTGEYIGIGVASLLSCFNPEMIVIAGGMTGMGNALLSAIRSEAKSRTYQALSEDVRIEFGVLGDRAGIIGAVGLSLMRSTASKQ